MAKVRVVVQPTGCINGNYWPEVGGELELPDQVAEDMAAAGWLEIVKVEKRPRSTAKVEKRG